MAKTAEFEEKTYEKYFGHELVRGRLISYSPGQAAENVLGFDEAYLVPWHIFYEHFNYLLKPPLSRLAGIDPNELNVLATELGRQLPPLRLNMFVQFKRPEYLAGPRAAQRKLWNCAYYRYKITKHQQETLEKLHSISADRSIVVYAAPAFWTKIDLFTTVEKREIISRSNIVSVDKLTGHRRYTYISPGGNGIACSTPVRIESQELDSAIAEGLTGEEMPFDQHLKVTAKLIEEAVVDDADAMQLLKQARAAIIGELADEVGIVRPGDFLYSLLTIEAFCDAFGVSYHALG